MFRRCSARLSANLTQLLIFTQAPPSNPPMFAPLDGQPQRANLRNSA